MSYLLQLELQIVVSCHMGVGSQASATAASALNERAVSPDCFELLNDVMKSVLINCVPMTPNSAQYLKGVQCVVVSK